MTARRLRVVIVNYNGGPLLSRAVESAQSADWGGPIDVVVVDNDSVDGSIGALDRFDRVTVIERESNEGFAANNHGFADLLGENDELDLEPADYVALLNPDAAVTPTAFRRLAAALDRDPHVGAAAPHIVFDRPFVEIVVTSGDVTVTSVESGGDEVISQCHPIGDAHRLPGRTDPLWRCPAGTGIRVPMGQVGQLRVTTHRTSEGVLDGHTVSGSETIVVDAITRPTVNVVQNAGSRIAAYGTGQNRGFATLDGAQRFGAVAPAWCGAAVLFSAEHLRDVGGFDPSFFLYYEDIDLSVRGIARGWSTAYVPDAVVLHRHSDKATQGTRRVEVLQHRNRLLVLARHAPATEVVRAFARAVVTPASLLVSSFGDPHASARRRLARWRVRSFVEAVTRLPDALRGRRAIRRRSTVGRRRTWELAGGS